MRYAVTWVEHTYVTLTIEAKDAHEAEETAERMLDDGEVDFAHSPDGENDIDSINEEESQVISAEEARD